MKLIVAFCALTTVATAKEAGIWNDGVAFLEGVAGKVSGREAAPAVSAQVHNSSASMATLMVSNSRTCFAAHSLVESDYRICTQDFCDKKCGFKNTDCRTFCGEHTSALFVKLGGVPRTVVSSAALLATAHEAAGEEQAAMDDLAEAQNRMRRLNAKIRARVQKEGSAASKDKLARLAAIDGLSDQVDKHLATVATFKQMAETGKKMKDEPVLPPSDALPPLGESFSFLQRASVHQHSKAPEDELAKEMTHDLEMNFNKIAPFGKEDTAKELQDHAAKTQDTLVDAVENAEVAEIKRAVFRALTRLRAATIKEFDTIARLETQAIDAYNDAHHYRAENPLAHLHEDEAPVETDKLKSFH